MKRAGKAVATVVLCFFVVRAIVEPFVSRPGTYDPADWGGPSYAGVLAVHMVPGVAALMLIYLLWRRKH